MCRLKIQKIIELKIKSLFCSFFSFIDWVCGLWKFFLLIMLLDCWKISLKIIIQPYLYIVRMWDKCCIYLKSQELLRFIKSSVEENSGSIQIIYLYSLQLETQITWNNTKNWLNILEWYILSYYLRMIRKGSNIEICWQE